MYYDTNTYMELMVMSFVIALVLLPCIVYICFERCCRKTVNKILTNSGEEIQEAKDDIFEYLGEKAYIKNEYYYFDLYTIKSRSIVEKIPYREMYYFNKYVVKEYRFDKYICPLYKELEDVEIIYKNAIKQSRKVYSIINGVCQGKFSGERFYNKIFRSLIGISAKDISPITFKVEFSYVSPKGQSRLSNYIFINKNFLKRYIKYDEDLKETNTYNSNERNKLTPALRTKIFERDNYTCCYCGASLANGRTDELHCDHIYPIAKGGTTRMSNLQTLCKSCNLNKGDKWREIDKMVYMKRNNGNLPE